MRAARRAERFQICFTLLLGLCVAVFAIAAAAAAVAVAVEPEHTVFYFYNPFDGDVLAQVLSTIGNSLRDAPRTVWLLYTNPVHRDLVERLPGFVEGRREAWGSEETIVYRFDSTQRADHDRTHAVGPT